MVQTIYEISKGFSFINGVCSPEKSIPKTIIESTGTNISELMFNCSWALMSAYKKPTWYKNAPEIRGIALKHNFSSDKTISVKKWNLGFSLQIKLLSSSS